MSQLARWAVCALACCSVLTQCIGCGKGTAPQPPSGSAAAKQAGGTGSDSGTTAAPRLPFSGADAYATLAELVQQQRYYAAPGRPKAIEFLKERLGKHSDEVRAFSFSVTERGSGKSYELTNLVGRIHPSRPVRYLVASHWDSRLWAEEDPNPKLREQPGQYANDSGSGVALVLTLGRYLRELTQVGIDLVLFDGEEFGRPGSSDYCQGAEHFARNLKGLGWPIPRGAIVMDMVGDAELDIFLEVSSAQNAPELTRLIWGAARDLSVGAFHDQDKYAIVDDQTPLQRLGIPAVLLIDYDYPHWHKHSDTLDKTSAKSLGEVGSVLLESLRRLDRGDRRASGGSAPSW